ncbi:MAG TPA: DinB family protein [Candidatus Sulfotelmatobacter sp.]
MELGDYLRRQFAYNAWANREVMAAMRESGDERPQLLRLMAHIMSAESLWLERLKGEPQSMQVWPDLDLDQCETHATKLSELWVEYLRQMSATGLSEKISYRNSKGESWSNTVQDVLTHVVMHSAYHRGQIASMMRAAGQTPAYIDFIHAVRRGFVE